jgi:bacterioferritin
MVNRDGLHIGSTVPEMLESDLRVELAVDQALKDVMALCEKEQDYVTRNMLQVLIDDTESDHAFWLEQQLRLIKTIGLPNYLQSQM